MIENNRDVFSHSSGNKVWNQGVGRVDFPLKALELILSLPLPAPGAQDSVWLMAA